MALINGHTYAKMAQCDELFSVTLCHFGITSEFQTASCTIPFWHRYTIYSHGGPLNEGDVERAGHVSMAASPPWGMSAWPDDVVARART